MGENLDQDTQAQFLKRLFLLKNLSYWVFWYCYFINDLEANHLWCILFGCRLNTQKSHDKFTKTGHYVMLGLYLESKDFLLDFAYVFTNARISSHVKLTETFEPVNGIENRRVCMRVPKLLPRMACVCGHSFHSTTELVERLIFLSKILRRMLFDLQTHSPASKDYRNSCSSNHLATWPRWQFLGNTDGGLIMTNHMYAR